MCGLAQVIPESASLCSVLPEPGQEVRAKVCLISRSEPLLPPDTRILGQLLAIRPKDEAEPQLRFDGEDGVMGSLGSVPAVMINNAVLRQVRGSMDVCARARGHACVCVCVCPVVQHFRQLTLSFLKPFNRYFHVDKSAVLAQLRCGVVGLYDDLAPCFLPKFTEEVRRRAGVCVRVCACLAVV